ncbi:MAG: hypothetical protein HY608_07440 [Planctomycetes bacterium]|nr:hypothetical protein [Planctomycetota bacterium]
MRSPSPDRPRPTASVAALLASALALVADGLFLLHRDLGTFEYWIEEDSFVEWATFGILLGMTVLAARRAVVFGPGGARRIWIAATLVCLFGAAEEISYGQRVVGWDSPPWFLEHNRQQETNVHNLMWGQVNINRVIFGKWLTIAIVLYLLVLTPLARRGTSLRAFVDRLGVPLPRASPILLYIAVALVVRAHHDITDETNELMELYGCATFLAILLDPANPEAAAPGAGTARC